MRNSSVRMKLLFLISGACLFISYVLIFIFVEYNHASEIFQSKISETKLMFEKVAKNKAIKNIIALDLYGTIEDLIVDFAVNSNVDAFLVKKDSEKIVSWGRTKTLFFDIFRDDEEFYKNNLSITVLIDSSHSIHVFINPSEVIKNYFVRFSLSKQGSLIKSFLLAEFISIKFSHIATVLFAIIFFFFIMYFISSIFISWMFDLRLKSQQLHDLKNETAFLKLIGMKLSDTKNINIHYLNSLSSDIDRVIAFKRSVFSDSKTEKVNFDIKECVNEVIDYIKNFFFIDSVDFKLDSSKSFGDPKYLKRSLYNLIINGIRAVEDNSGRVIVETGKRLNISYVSISNPGIIEKKMFKRGVSGNNSSGEGLSIAYEYAKKSGADIFFTNNNNIIKFCIEFKNE